MIELNYFENILNLQSLSQIQINKARWLFLSQIGPLLTWVSFFVAAGAVVVKIGLSLKPNHH